MESPKSDKSDFFMQCPKSDKSDFGWQGAAQERDSGAAMRGLKDRTVIVTGGANGIGAAIARRLAEEGCAVGILDLDAAGGEKLVGEIAASGGRASLFAVDITDYDAVSRAV